jgi:hypothetical protein
VPDGEAAKLKQQEDAMDPITAINMEFAHRVQAEWSRAAADGSGERATPVSQARAANRLRVMLGNRLIAVGTWMKQPARLVRAGH